MKQFIVDFNKWENDGKRYVYPDVPEKNNWYDKGLVPKNDFTADLYGWYGFTFETEVFGEEEIEIKVGLLDFGEVNSEEVEDYFYWRSSVCGNGTVKIAAPLAQFDLLSSMPARWRFVRSVEINRNVKNLRAVKGLGICAEAAVKSKAAEADEVITYPVTIKNYMSEKQVISLSFEKTGYEVLSPYIDCEKLMVEPGAECEINISVKMSERITPGGFEKHIIHVTPNGNGIMADTIELYSVRKLGHPYIAAAEEIWTGVKSKIENYEWAKKIADLYVSRAEEWVVPEPELKENFMFVTDNAHKAYNSAIAWKLTGRLEFAEKTAEFLKKTARYYPDKMKACNQQLVHEGEFFKSCAKAYDLIHDTGVFTEDEHEMIHRAFRVFIEFLDWALCDGGISNWSLAEIAGALYCSMALQDRERIERFVFGKGGILDHLRAGVYSDGWWCECTIGYNQMAAGLFSEYTVALRPWGINLASLWVPAQYSNKVHFRNQHIDGLSWDIYGENTRNYRCIEDLWDSLVAMANYRSVVQGVNDSAEERFEGASPVAFDSRYDLAYYIYRKPEYAYIIKSGGENSFRDLFYGVAELPEIESDRHRQSCYFNNGGISLLRSRTEGRDDSEQFEISLKYGSHGGAHGHYDRCALNAVSRYGKALINPENIWYSYGTFMYKFFVQNSINHNMVTVDLKLQDPQDNRQLLFHSGKVFNASVVETKAAWSNPPYGGWKVFSNETFADRIWIEGRYVPIPENPPAYSTRTEFTEPILQRRMAVLTDDYVVCFDYMQGENEHDYHCIYHLPGFKGIENAALTDHTEQLEANPLSSAQFITDVDYYEADGNTKLSFEYEYDEKVSAKAPWVGAQFRSGHNVPGVIKTDVYFVGDKKTEIVSGRDPEYYPVSKRLFYSVKSGERVLTDGKFGAWILGREHIDVDISGLKTLSLCVRTEDGKNDHHIVRETKPSIFWGDPYFVTADGEKIYLADGDYTTENVNNGLGIGVDYEGGPVKIMAKPYDKAVPGDVCDKSKEGVITIDISGLNAVRFVSDIGGDYPLGDESLCRRFSAQKKCGKTARFTSVLEPYTDKKMIKDIAYVSENELKIELNDGRTQKIIISGLDGSEKVTAEVLEYKDGELIRSERA